MLSGLFGDADPVVLEMGGGGSGVGCYLRDIWCTNMGFRSISEMLPQQRADELLPLGLMLPLGGRGYDRLAEVEDAREALLPRLEESFRRPDSTYAFRNGDTREWRVSGANVLQVEAGQVTYQDVTGASPGLPQTEPWTLAWRTGLAEWTADVQQLGGAWVRRSGVQGESWESLRDIEALQDIDLQVWLPHWPAWRYLPRRAVSAAEGPVLHPAPEAPTNAAPNDSDRLRAEMAGWLGNFVKKVSWLEDGNFQVGGVSIGRIEENCRILLADGTVIKPYDLHLSARARGRTHKVLVGIESKNDIFTLRESLLGILSSLSVKPLAHGDVLRKFLNGLLKYPNIDRKDVQCFLEDGDGGKDWTLYMADGNSTGERRFNLRGYTPGMHPHDGVWDLLGCTHGQIDPPPIHNGMPPYVIESADLNTKKALKLAHEIIKVALS